MLECKAAICDFDELHRISQEYAAKHKCIQMGAATVCNKEIVFNFKPVADEESLNEFFLLLKPLDRAEFWKALPKPNSTGWITLTEDMTRRLIEKEAQLSFPLEDIMYLYDGILLLEKDPCR